MATIDVLTATATATHLTHLLQSNTLTSVDIVNAYLAQITKHNHSGLGLRALISVNLETALSQAADRDKERAQGYIRGPLHGIPIIVKDAIITAKSLGLPTTAGAVAFKDTYGKQNAAVIDHLLDQGLIILGKASMTEFCGLKAFCMTAGWSAVNGMTQSAYIQGGFRSDDLFIGRSGPGGSSSGSGVGVSAGFAPLSIGTETSGSICMPANRAGLYSLVATRGSVSMEGVFSLSSGFDRLGGMAKCPEDLALLMRVLNGTRGEEGMWGDVRVGFVDPVVWDAFGFQKERDEDVERQILDKYEWAREQIARRGGRVVYPVELPSMEDLKYEGKSVSYSVAFYEFPGLFRKFCSLLDAPRVTSVEELVEYNEQNAASAMPEPHSDQKDLIDTLHSSMAEESVAAAKAYGHRRAGPEGIDAALEKHQIDLIIGPGDCATCAVAALAGYPTAMLPMSRLEGKGGMGQPQGLMVVGSAGSEGKMLQLMQRWGEVVGPWEVPPLLVD
ncbi:amidase [Aspergillus sclerotioniger CBS 115572]|uniref:Amidase n=1 Tax=Aspergillus sclerotioniger CBS 115572 TaxID=1450535 RepID=A0A317XBV9_9EURO|nr:amidase [Aspergillus sclerotioniger CBS 115572]PWY96124.1 amidase [Aspergillus sclerotioniger CBS 115572]